MHAKRNETSQWNKIRTCENVKTTRGDKDLQHVSRPYEQNAYWSAKHIGHIAHSRALADDHAIVITVRWTNNEHNSTKHTNGCTLMPKNNENITNMKNQQYENKNRNHLEESNDDIVDLN